MKLIASATVPGDARPEGALVAGRTKDGKTFLRHRDGDELNYWRGKIEQAVRDQVADGPSDRPISVAVHFYLARPRGHFGKGGLRPSAPRYPSNRGSRDIDKLARSVLDALTHVAFHDDSQVVQLHLGKHYADDSMEPGARISVWEEE